MSFTENENIFGFFFSRTTFTLTIKKNRNDTKDSVELDTASNAIARVILQIDRAYCTTHRAL